MGILPQIFHKIYFEKEFPLTPESIDQVTAAGEEFFKEWGFSRNESLKLQLELETMLVYYLEAPSDYDTFIIRDYRKFNHRYIRLELVGEKYEFTDVTDENKEYFQVLADTMSENQVMGIYKYHQGVNIYDFRLPSRPVNPVFYTVVALVAAILTGAASTLLPPEVAQALSEDVFDPVFDVCMGLLGMLSTLMVFFAVLTGICNVGNIDSFSKRGRIIIGHFVGLTAIEAVLATAICRLLYDFTEPQNAGSLAIFTELLHRILAMIPTNLVEPFAEGNAMHVLFLAIGLGMLILMNSERSRTLIKGIEELNLNIMTGIAQICRLTPLIIYLSVSMMFMNGSLTAVLGTWQIFAVIILVSLIEITGCLELASIRLKQPLMKLLKDSIPVGLAAFTTASSAVCTSGVMEICEKAYGIDQKRTDMYFPMYQMFCKMGGCCRLVAFIYIMCGIYGVTLDLTTVILNILVFTLMAVAVAPVSGGMIPIAIIMINAAGLPAEAIAIFTAVSFPMDMICTGMRMLLAPANIALVDKKINGA